jgi:hypothetical protein
LTFFSWSKEIGKSAKQMLHFIQHDTTANCERSEGFGFPWRPLRSFDFTQDRLLREKSNFWLPHEAGCKASLGLSYDLQNAG